ncbi:Mss4-like protein [Aspergillus caelatus]|uniref:Mss4-like protein n=1 Tax=Aspergillus caelatus TaxID=61420 RepID=A0A5N7ABX3_9EURO|nr:Mss4-like protein [Aspergillus caelatus]KAE8366828.1 Mss4-like protein [Aspergillus caelatus]
MTSISTGNCLCGACAYSYTSEPAVKAICHCNPCRKVSGGTNTVNFVVPDENFTLTVFFCTERGNTLWKEATSKELKGLKLVQVGTLSDTSKLNGDIDAVFYAPNRASWLVPLPRAAQWAQF